MKRLTTLAAVLLVLSACGADDDADGDKSNGGNNSVATDLVDAPPCSDLQVGDVLPEDFTGCQSDDGSVVDPKSTECDDGTRLFEVGDDLWAIGGQALQTKDGTAFDAALKACAP